MKSKKQKNLFLTKMVTPLIITAIIVVMLLCVISTSYRRSELIIGKSAEIKRLSTILTHSGLEIEEYVYTFEKGNEIISDITVPTYFKLGDKITVIKTDVQNNSTSYEYIVASKYLDNTHMQYMTLTEPESEETIGSVSFSNETGTINVAEANLYFDTISPSIKAIAYVEENNENNIISKDKEILIIVNTSEPIKNKDEVPEIKVSFSQSGLGKYNYQGENATTGNAKYIQTIENTDGTVSWEYRYKVEQGDEGQLQIEFISGELVDFAENITDIVKLYIPSDPDSIYSEIKEFKNIEISSLKFYEDSSCTKEINPIENLKILEDLYIRVELNGKLYTGINTVINNNTAPLLYLNNNISTTIESITDGKILVYKYDKETLNSLTKVEYITLKNEKEILYTEEDLVAAASGIEKDKNYTKDIDNFYLDPIKVSDSIDSNEIVVDTMAPTVEITAKDVEKSITNKDIITYEFRWSEKIKEFTIENITVNNGKIVELSNVTIDEDGKYLYTAKIETYIADGNVGDLQVIIEQDVCKDLVGKGNIRNENIIKVDRKAPVLVNLEAVAISDIKLNEEVDVIKEYYKADELENNSDVVVIVATFSENIEESEIPALALQFSESGSAGKIDEDNIEVIGNKIYYLYPLEISDQGKLSIKGFSGKVVDNVGNEASVTKKILEGNSIIADTVAPKLKELNIVSSNADTYKAGQTITIEAIYDEELYILENNEIKNITKDNMPNLGLKFGQADAIGEVIAEGYVQVDGQIDKTKIKYTYTIEDGDNGILSIVSYIKKENLEVCDIAGNKAALDINQTENTIIVDTLKPTVMSCEAIISNMLIKGVIGDQDGSEVGYYKKGNKLEIVFTFSEENVTAIEGVSKIQVGFTDNIESIPEVLKEVVYTNNKFIYEIQEGDNGYLYVKLDEDQFTDLAGNGNKLFDGHGRKAYADTTKPAVVLSEDVKIEQNNQTITIEATFSENVYDLNGDTRVSLTKENAPKLIYSFGNGANKEIGAVSVEGKKITYTLTKDPVEDNGTLNYKLAKGNLCDKAGNLYYEETTDTTAPVLQGVEITTNAQADSEYCEEGNEIYVIATFNENIEMYNMKLTVKVGNAEVEELNGQLLESDPTKIKFTYTVKAGDMGQFKIVDVCGENNSSIVGETLDNTYGWVQDEYGNQNNIYSLEAEGINVAEIEKIEIDTGVDTDTDGDTDVDTDTEVPEIIFEDIQTLPIDGVKYVKISSQMTAEDITDLMNKEALCGQTPEYTKLTEDNKIKTGSEITLDGKTEYIIVVNGDINCDGKVTFTDIIKANAVRIGSSEDSISKAQLLAADINNTEKIEFRDIISINTIRINSAN